MPPRVSCRLQCTEAPQAGVHAKTAFMQSFDGIVADGHRCSRRPIDAGVRRSQCDAIDAGTGACSNVTGVSDAKAASRFRSRTQLALI